MTNKQEHPQAKWLRAIADGETLQCHSTAESRWYDLVSCDVLSLIAADHLNTRSLRIKPPTITIGKYEVPAPMLVAPPEGTVYFYICPGADGCLDASRWEGVFELERRQIKSGMCWLKREDAELAAKAIRELLTGGWK